jgi:hypothetical protein
MGNRRRRKRGSLCQRERESFLVYTCLLHGMGVCIWSRVSIILDHPHLAAWDATACTNLFSSLSDTRTFGYIAHYAAQTEWSSFGEALLICYILTAMLPFKYILKSILLESHSIYQSIRVFSHKGSGI